MLGLESRETYDRARTSGTKKTKYLHPARYSVGQAIGRLLILEHSIRPEDPNNKHWYKVKCMECGRILHMNQSKISDKERKKKTMCGDCLRSKLIKKNDDHEAMERVARMKW